MKEKDLIYKENLEKEVKKIIDEEIKKLKYEEITNNFFNRNKCVK